jgi:hypothetical protein
VSREHTAIKQHARLVFGGERRKNGTDPDDIMGENVESVYGSQIIIIGLVMY